jgi:hypothetical protein
MKLIKTNDGQTFGPFQSALTLTDRIVADGIEFPFTTLDHPTVVDAPDGYEAPPTIPTIKDYTDATQIHLDATARAHNYDGILSACTYASSSVPKFAAEGQACVLWRDSVWATCYAILGEVQSGQRPAPTIPELLGLLPAMNWPEV